MTETTPRPKLICLDFDGVLHSYTSGWKGAAEIPDPPVPGAMDFINSILRDDRFELAIYSSRSGQEGGIEAMQQWVYFWLIAQTGCGKDHAWNAATTDIKWPTEKPPATVSIDDRALTFTGEWPSLADLATFQPWNKLKELPPLRPISRKSYGVIRDKLNIVNTIIEKMTYTDAIAAMRALTDLHNVIEEGLPGHECVGECENCNSPMGINEAVDVTGGEAEAYFCKFCAEETTKELA